MKIKMTGLNYQLNDEGSTAAVTVNYSNYEGSDAFNTSVNITQEDLDANIVLDDLGRKDFDAKAREMMKAWIDEV